MVADLRAASLTVDTVCWGPSATQPMILQPVSFQLAAGRVLGVVGANGAGKTTLLRLLYRWARPLGGRIMIDGQDIWQMPARAAARRIAAVLQEQPTDFALTVREVVALGRIPHRQGFARPGQRCNAQIDQALLRLDLAHLEQRAFGTLSGGERQRCMVARALAQEPQILVLDEPTNHLDIRHQLEVIALIRDLDVTIVTSLHDLNLAAELCDDILLLRQGQAVAFGAPGDVLTPARVSAAFDVGVHAEHLSLSGRQHLTYHLANTDTGYLK